MEKEVQLILVSEVRDRVQEELRKAIAELNPLLYIKDVQKIIELNNAVKIHRVTGKPLKLGRKTS